MLIFEGGLRKWVFPGLSNVLLVVRDPIGLWLLIYAAYCNIKYWNIYCSIIFSITIISVFAALLVGHGNLVVALYGARITIIHFPLIFLIGAVFNKKDVIMVGKFIVWITIPMTLLIAAQFYSPQSSFVNRGIGGNLEGAGFGGADGYFRPSGTFSFTSGNSLYYGFAAPFIFYFLLHSQEMKKIFVYISILTLLLAIPLSISRTLFFEVLLTIVFTITSFVGDSKKVGQIVGAFVGLIIVVIVLSSTDVFNTSIDVFTHRFENANESEGGTQGVLLDRFLGGMINAITTSSENDVSFFGQGIGKGTNVGSQLLVGGIIFLVAEGEWGRIMGELGIFFGLIFIIIRIMLTSKIAYACYEKLKSKDALPWLLLSFSLLIVLQGGWAQPPNLGFFVIGTGLTISSIQDKQLVTND